MQHPIHKPHRKVIYKFNENVDNINFFMLTTSFRKVTAINLGCASYAFPCDFAINIEDLIKLSDVMNEHSLGPDGEQNHLDEDPRAAKYWSFLIEFIPEFFKPNSVLQTKLCSTIHAWFPVFSTLWKIVCNFVDDINFKYKIIPITKLDSTTGHMVKDVKRCLAETMILIVRSSIYVGLFEGTKRSSIGNPVKSIDKTNGFFFSGIEDSAVEFSKIAILPLDWDYYLIVVIVYRV
ncbi:hypothetical protein SADUNF_Sadunf02G0099100 [Salix dunnii]|uniref:Uncharacterized protein n=1 Tax=Salix dunnii TaxID=1413687 RepID=A0A835N731_9ROSI|nr:hypothetical protein SADUNF_Sadunf02G0099100 [Salix dunnii]